jgi:hypothetical protein
MHTARMGSTNFAEDVHLELRWALSELHEVRCKVNHLLSYFKLNHFAVEYRVDCPAICARFLNPLCSDIRCIERVPTETAASKD